MSAKIINSSLAGENRILQSLWFIVPGVLILGLLIVLIVNYHSSFSIQAVKDGFDTTFLIILLIGIFAQLVDGTLGMGYGATATSFLLSFGFSPAISSMGVHVAEMFTTGASAISHYKFKNINKKLVLNLLIPGVAGSITGAYLLSDIIDGNAIKPYIAGYMIVLAVIIIIKGLKKTIVKKKTKRLGALAVFGGFMDSIGGGGWGPIVTSTLMGQGRNPRYTIGSVNTAEFAISFASGVTFMIFEGINGWQVIIALILGGIVAAPVSAFLINKIPRKPITILVGILLICLSIKTLVKYI
ncbi:MAG: sulfite exporter TauE/SafE family protein [Sphingobacteriaceae bacterium]|nr:sulfite exporter TauE/SafE family protein [Sphingobacteriaceae bacterium]